MRARSLLPLLALTLAACSPTLTPSLPPAPSLTPTSLPVSTSTPTLTPRPSLVPPALPVVHAPPLAHISFQDDLQGWAIALNDSGSILRTVDGGQTWLNATPSGAGQIGLSTVLYGTDPAHAWLLTP